MGYAAQIERIIAKGQLVPLVFMQSDVAAGQTAAALTVAEVRDAAALADDQNAADSYVLPWDFEVVGISVRSSAARTAGSVTVEGAKNGTGVGLSATLDATNTQSHYARQRRGADRGVAGDRVGALISSPSWTPVTADVVVVVWVIAHLEGV